MVDSWRELLCCAVLFDTVPASVGSGSEASAAVYTTVSVGTHGPTQPSSQAAKSTHSAAPCRRAGGGPGDRKHWRRPGRSGREGALPARYTRVTVCLLPNPRGSWEILGTQKHDCCCQANYGGQPSHHRCLPVRGTFFSDVCCNVSE